MSHFLLLVFLERCLSLDEPYLWKDCLDLIQKIKNFIIAIVSLKGSDYRIHFWHMSKNEAINIMKNSNLDEKKKDYYKFLSLYIKMSETIYYQRNRETISNRAKQNYKSNKEKSRKKSKKWIYRVIRWTKYINGEYGRNTYQNMSKEKEQI